MLEIMTAKKTALITGANQGLGFETAKQLAKQGYYIYIGCRNKLKGVEALKKLNELGLSNVELVEIDVTDINSIKSARQIIEAKTPQLDVLINNAGISGEQPQTMSSGSIDNLRKVFDTNFFGAVQTTQQFIELLKKSDEPRIVNVSSGLVSLTNHSKSTDYELYEAYTHFSGLFAAYCSSKAALNTFTILLAKEFRDTNFKINSVEPGYTATNLNQHQGTQTVEQGVVVIVKYATADNDAPTGKFFSIDGEFAW
jgi:NAD(P)-dependent dehydrogenase (short-subunit alcohol dehydrogenase family)